MAELSLTFLSVQLGITRQVGGSVLNTENHAWHTFPPLQKPRLTETVQNSQYCSRNTAFPALFFAVVSVADLVLSPRQTDKAAAGRNQLSKE